MSAHIYLSWLHPEKTAKVIVVGRERMLAYEGRFEKRGITLYDYTLDLAPAVRRVARRPIVPISGFAGRALEVPAATSRSRCAAEHFVECIRTGAEPLTSGARSLRVVEALETADRTRHAAGGAA